MIAMLRRAYAMKKRAWNGTLTRVLRATTWAVLIASTLSCGEMDGGTDRPNLTIAPVAPMRFVFNNTTASVLYVDWSEGRAPVRILRDGQELAVDTGCVPLCEQACGCMSCAAPEHRVLKIEPGSRVELAWEPIHHVFRSCPDSPSCSCAEPWPVTSGTYAVRLAAATAIKGGTPSPSEPDMLDGAAPDWSAPGCVATSTFALAGGARVALPFNCD